MPLDLVETSWRGAVHIQDVALKFPVASLLRKVQLGMIVHKRIRRRLSQQDSRTISWSRLSMSIAQLTRNWRPGSISFVSAIEKNTPLRSVSHAAPPMITRCCPSCVLRPQMEHRHFRDDLQYTGEVDWSERYPVEGE